MATRADVAKLAGVSASTVSYALSGERPIKPETREKILKAVAELNYVPHLAAGALAGRKARALALLFAGNELSISPVALEYVTGAANAARERDYHLILWPSDDAALSEVERFSKSGLLGGVLLMEIKLNDSRVDELVRLGIPVTMIGRTNEPGDVPFVDRNFEEVARNAMGYLGKLGHKKIGFLTQLRTGEERTLGVDNRFNSEMQSAARQQGVTLIEKAIENTAESGRQACFELMRDHPDVTSMISLPDLATLGFLSATREISLRIPEDLSVLAVNTPDNQLGMAWPPLSTITVPASDMGRAAANILIDLLEGIKPEISQQLWTGDLVVRGTTAAARVK